MNQRSREITRLLQQWSDGSQEAFDQLSEKVYPELKELAQRHVRRERPGRTLQPTALVNEAYLRMVGKAEGNWLSRLQFFKFASTIMRHILVDYFRASKAKKRGAGAPKVTFDDALEPSRNTDIDLLKLEDSLVALHAINPLQCRIVELRFYGGLTVNEVAVELKLSRSKVKREWAAARSWLYREISGGS